MQKKSAFKRIMETIAAKLFIILIILMLFTMVMSSGVLKGAPISAMFSKGFMASNNLRAILYGLVIQCVMACGISCLLIGGNIDLSGAGQATLATMVFAILVANAKLPWFLALLITLAMAVCFGLINSVLVLKLKFPAFIATIGMSSVYKGLCNIVTKGFNVNIPDNGFTRLCNTAIGVFPVIFIIALVLMLIFQLTLSKTRFGRNIYMRGGNPNAARLAGINIDKMTVILFIIYSVMAALGGLLWTGQLKMASPTSIIQAAPDMKAMSAAMLGGVAFTGGAGNIGGPLIALLLVNVLDNMLKVLGVPTYWTTVAQGVVLILALIFDYVSAERRRKALLAGSAGK